MHEKSSACFFLSYKIVARFRLCDQSKVPCSYTYIANADAIWYKVHGYRYINYAQNRIAEGLGKICC